MAPVGTGTAMLVALQLVGVAAVPLNVTVLEPWLEPKFVPVIVTEVPTVPLVGDKLVMLGAAPPPLATLNAASTAPQESEAAIEALAEAEPAAAWAWSSDNSFVFGSAGTKSSAL